MYRFLEHGSFGDEVKNQRKDSNFCSWADLESLSKCHSLARRAEAKNVYILVFYPRSCLTYPSFDNALSTFGILKLRSLSGHSNILYQQDLSCFVERMLMHPECDLVDESGKADRGKGKELRD